MKIHLTAQQLSFYTNHSYIGFTDLPLVSLHQELEPLLKSAPFPRDLWRYSPSLQHILTHTLGPIALQLAGRQTLHLALDQWILATETWDTASAIQNRLSFQSLAIVVCIPQDEKSPSFFMHPSCWPSLIPHWPPQRPDCYLVAFGGPDSLYILNPQDPLNHCYKKLGYALGDSIRKNPRV